MAPQLVTKPFRKDGRGLTSDTVRQLLTQNRQRHGDHTFGIGPDAQSGPGLHLRDELLVAHLVLLLEIDDECLADAVVSPL
ncbi:MAG TPA: hypothetical protein VIY28_06590 [Pseudonocardiaceae bacterium]